MPNEADDGVVDPDVDFERLKVASLALAVILAEAKASPGQQTVVGVEQIRAIHDALSDAMMGFAWLRDELIGLERGDFLLSQLQAGLSDQEQRMLVQLFNTPALRAD